MYKRFWIICSVVAAGLLVLSGFGLSLLGMYGKGLAAERRQEFMAVAEQVRFDVKKQLDDFFRLEQARPWTDYQNTFVPETTNQAAAFVKSPLAEAFSNDLAAGYFQLDPAGQIITPYTAVGQEMLEPEVAGYLANIRTHLLPSLRLGLGLQTRRIEPTPPALKDEETYDYDKGASERYPGYVMDGKAEKAKEEIASSGKVPAADESPIQAEKVLSKARGADSRRGVYPISSLEEARQNTQVVQQSRAAYEMNVDNTQMQMEQAPMMGVAMDENRQSDAPPQSVRSQAVQSAAQSAESQVPVPQMARRSAPAQRELAEREPIRQDTSAAGQRQIEPRPSGVQQAAYARDVPTRLGQPDTVQVRIEPFVPITVPEPDGRNGIFAGQIFLLRHIQIEDRHWVQGFQLNETELLSRVAESVQRLLRRGMGYEISRQERPDAAHTAILDFGFGEVVLNLLEQQPGWIQMQAVRFRNWFFGILGVVWLAVFASIAALWKNMYEQVQLSRKKDDFISAVSHELRTPLTSIRMYTEMLEKDWIRTDDKRREYYATMRQESERLTRLIENVLDFSRIQRGKKQFTFAVGDVNAAIGQVTEMMRPCMERAGFMLVQELAEIEPFVFDRDAVMQIVVNLLDNAIKYARGGEDKHIFLRTRQVKDKVIIEVEDRGPGIPRNQQKKIFDAFYRCGDESTRQTTGTGLGLALVKRFAEAHSGFVECAAAKPSGALFRVALANRYNK